MTTRIRHVVILALLALASLFASLPWQAAPTPGHDELGLDRLSPALAEHLQSLSWTARASQHVASKVDTPVGAAALAILIAALVSWLTCWAIVRYQHLHSHLTHDAVDSGPQKFHTTPTPRVGGLALGLGLVAAWAMMRIVHGNSPTVHDFGLLLLCGIPAFAGGLVEDLTKKVGVTDRLLLTMLSGALAAWLLGAVLTRIGIPGVDHLFIFGLVAIPFTVFAVGGVANAVNIIDGYNGLVAGYSIMVLLAFAFVAHQVGDPLVLVTSLTLAAAMLGFMQWNWPGGKIFLGDGGAYSVGFVLAELAVLLVLRHPGVSPWFPTALLAYPIYETLFSIFRRTVVLRSGVGQPDCAHLHQLVYRARLSLLTRSGATVDHVRQNSETAKYFWAPIALSVAISAIAWDKPSVVFANAVATCVLYTYAYIRIASRTHLALPDTARP